ncbi:MAG: hypothetical protein ABH812_01500, partial [bacterium]
MLNIDVQKIKRFFQNLQNRGFSVKEIRHRLNSVDNFINWASKKGILNANEYKQLQEGIAEIQKKIGSIFYRIAPNTWLNRLKKYFDLKIKSKKEEVIHSKTNEPVRKPWFTKPLAEFDIRHYIGISIVLLIIATLGAGAYNQFFKNAQTPFAFPTNLTTGGRVLSFQGRLTDSLGNPISTGTNLTFKLYNVSSGGSALYNTSACSITPDQDGIFDVLIGGSSYSPTPPQEVCGTEIPENLFSDWPNVYLGITMGADTEATPRQQIANVGYAINSETLQGFPPGTGVSNIPYINNQGDIIIATSAAGIRNTWASTNFTLSSSGTITLQSAGTGDVALTATGSGNITSTLGQGTSLFNVLSGNLKVGNGTPGVTLDGEDVYIEGTLEIDSATTLDGTLTTNGTVTLGDNGDTVTINSSDWDITAEGNASGLGTITADGKLSVAVAGLASVFQNTSDSAVNQVATFGSGNRATPANNDEGYLSLLNDDSTGTQVEFSRLTWVAADVLNTSKDAEIQFDVQNNNSLTKILSVQGTGIDIVGEVDLSGQLIAGSGNITLTDATGNIQAGAYAAGSITEADLKVVDAPGDEECFTYEVTTGDFEWQSCADTAIPDDSLDYVDFEDTMDLDANLALNQTTYTWGQDFTGTTTTGYTYSANSLTTGTAASFGSTSTAGGASGLSKV